MSATSDTLVRRLLERLDQAPTGPACTYIASDGRGTTVSFGALMHRAFEFAAQLGSPGENPLTAICAYHGLDLHASFVGAMLAGRVPTMLSPPSPRMDPAKYAGSFARMIEHVRPSTFVLDGMAKDKLEVASLAASLGDTRLLLTSDVDSSRTLPRGEVVGGTPNSIALVQHSSGTTGLQKGVALSHLAVLTHHDAYANRLGLRSEEDVIVSWLPLYHDMGLVACFLLPLLSGVHFVEMSPFDWVMRPGMLLDAIASYRGTFVWLPNFAYSFLAEAKRADAPPRDLSSVRAFVNCSEPVTHQAHERFLGAYADWGVSRMQLASSYAMAENVFAVTQSAPGSARTIAVSRRAMSERNVARPPDDAADTVLLTSNGRPMETTELQIDDTSSVAASGEDTVGEILIRGSHLFDGYLRNASRPESEWFHTGDIGFVHNGELFVSGRKKDLIIIQGRNFHAGDIEEIVSTIDGVEKGRIVAFGVRRESSATEELIVLFEVTTAFVGNARKLCLSVRQQIAQVLDCTPTDVRIVPSRWIVKSTSGKVARRDNSEKYLQMTEGGCSN